MLLPIDANPKKSAYYNGFIVLTTLKENHKLSLVDLYFKVSTKNDVSFSQLILALDWLYLIDVIKTDDLGMVSCT